jgi:hypothetical protein
MRAAYFSNPKAVGHHYIAKFSSSIPSKEDEKELPLALLALIMTGVSGSRTYYISFIYIQSTASLDL